MLVFFVCVFVFTNTQRLASLWDVNLKSIEMCGWVVVEGCNLKAAAPGGDCVRWERHQSICVIQSRLGSGSS